MSQDCVWELFDSLPEMLPMIEKILAPDARFVILTAYAIRSSFVALHEIMSETLETRGGLLESGELVLRTPDGGRALSTSMFSRWSMP